MGKDTLRIISPNGHLGFAPTKEESFYIGAATHPDYYCCDSGSDGQVCESSGLAVS